MGELISIVVPVYNVEDYLDVCINSIVNQTYRNLEIILVNDGSTDSSPQICNKWCNDDDRIRVIHRKNGGLSAARNSGIKVSKGNYIMFVDSDDWLELDSVYLMYYAAKQSRCDIVAGLYQEVNTNGQLDYKKNGLDGIITSQEAILHVFKDGRYSVSAWAKLFKKQIIENFTYPEGCLYEDSLTVFQLLDKALTVFMLDKVVYNYRIRNGSIMTTKSKAKSIEELSVWIKNYKYILNHHVCFSKEAKFYLLEKFVAFFENYSLEELDLEQLGVSSLAFLFSHLPKTIIWCGMPYKRKISIILRLLIIRRNLRNI